MYLYFPCSFLRNTHSGIVCVCVCGSGVYNGNGISSLLYLICRRIQDSIAEGYAALL